MEQFEELDIKRLLKIMVQSVNFIVVVTLLVGIVAFVYSETMVLPTYQSSVTMYINNNNRSTLLSKTQTSGADMQASQMLVGTYKEILKSETLTAKISEELERRCGLEYSAGQILSMLSADSVNNTEILKINITGTNPEHTALIANVVADVAPDVISEYIEASTVKIIDKAKTGSRVAPNVMRNSFIGLLIGLLYSCAYIIIREVFDTRVKSETDLEQWFNKSILGIIPEIGGSDSNSLKYYYYYRRNYRYGGYYGRNKAIGGYSYGKQQYAEFYKEAQKNADRASQKDKK